MDGFSSGKRQKDAGKLSDCVVALLADPGAHPHAGGLPKIPGIRYFIHCCSSGSGLPSSPTTLLVFPS